MTHRLAWFCLGAVLLLWGVTVVALWWPQAPVFRSTGTDTITPVTVRENAAFVVTRHFSVSRGVSVYTSRILVRGNCRPNCQVIDLPGEYSTLEAGDYVRSRVQILPQYVDAGDWRFRATFHWYDFLGRSRKFEFPEMMLKVEK